jgi:hypothetical protein
VSSNANKLKARGAHLIGGFLVLVEALIGVALLLSFVFTVRAWDYLLHSETRN